MNEFQNFSSLPPDQEAAFVVFEQRAAASTKSGITIGIAAGLAVGFLILLISFTVPAKKDARDAEAAGSQVQKKVPAEAPAK